MVEHVQSSQTLKRVNTVTDTKDTLDGTNFLDGTGSFDGTDAIFSVVRRDRGEGRGKGG